MQRIADDDAHRVDLRVLSDLGPIRVRLLEPVPARGVLPELDVHVSNRGEADIGE